MVCFTSAENHSGFNVNHGSVCWTEPRPAAQKCPRRDVVIILFSYFQIIGLWWVQLSVI